MSMLQGLGQFTIPKYLLFTQTPGFWTLTLLTLQFTLLIPDKCGTLPLFQVINCLVQVHGLSSHATAT